MAALLNVGSNDLTTSVERLFMVSWNPTVDNADRFT